MFKGAVSAYRGKGDGEQQGDDRHNGKGGLNAGRCDQFMFKCEEKSNLSHGVRL